MGGRDPDPPGRETLSPEASGTVSAADHRAEMIDAGAHLALSALERLPHRSADYDLLRALTAGPERNLFLAAQQAAVILTPGAWKIIAISLLTGAAPLAGDDLRRVALWRRRLTGPPDTVLGAAIELLALLEARHAGAFGAEEARHVCEASHVLALAAREGGHVDEANDLSLLGLGVGASPGAATLPAARMALDIAQRAGGRGVGVCAIEVALAWAAIAEADPDAVPAALVAWDFAAAWLPRIGTPDRAALAARLADAAAGRAFLAGRRDRLGRRV